MADIMNETPPGMDTDATLLAAFARGQRDAGATLAARYLPFVYASALRRTNDAERAAEVTRAVFLVFARRARKLRKRTVLAAWLFHVTRVASRKLSRNRGFFARLLERTSRAVLPPDVPLWPRVTTQIDAAMDRLPSKQRDAILVRCFLNHDLSWAAALLRTSERRVEGRNVRGLKKLARRLGRGIDPAALAAACAQNASTVVVPEALAAEIFQYFGGALDRRPALRLARRTLATLAWARWRRRIAVGVPLALVLFVSAAVIAWRMDARSGHSRSIATFLVWSVRNEGKRVPGLAQPAGPWPAEASTPRLDARNARLSGDLYRTTNIWLAHLKFSRSEWKALEPKRIGPLPNFLQPDGTALLRNPEAQRSGLAGVLGFDFPWSRADLEFGGVTFTNVAARLKGNGTWLASLYGDKRSFKIDLNEHVERQKLAGRDELNFHNLVADHSFMSDALGYEFFRDAGVPSPRTAYAWLTVSVAGKWDHHPLGLYAMIEPVDGDFAKEHLGSKKAPIFKPVTYQLFEDLGEHWAAYESTYDLKTRATASQQQRVIDFSRLVSFASDEAFAARAGEFLDLDEFARFLAALVLLSSYDSLLADGQNFYVYLDPRSNRFGFVPWDLDLAWGSFFLLGTTKEREQASVWHPWVGENRFLERVMNVPEFRRLYRAHLEDFLARLFTADRLHRRIDDVAAVIRSPIAAESDFRLNKFEQAIGARPLEVSKDAHPQGQNRPAHRLKRFIEKRTASVRAQLDGESEGIILRRGGRSR